MTIFNTRVCGIRRGILDYASLNRPVSHSEFTAAPNLDRHVEARCRRTFGQADAKLLGSH